MGGPFAVCIDTNGKADILSLKTGKKISISGFVFIGNTEVSVNPDNTLIMFTQFDETAKGLAIESLGVLNINNEKLTMLSREGYENRYEASVSWFDNKRIVIWATSDKDDNDNYLYIYEFKNEKQW